MDTRLNFINKSKDTNNTEVVIFQKNVATNIDEVAVAWQVIKNCGIGGYHPFIYTSTLEVTASDSWGNYTPHITAQYGQLFSMVLTTSGNRLIQSGCSTNPNEVQMNNNLPEGAINANIYKGRKLLASKTSIFPMQKAVFQFKPTIWIGAASQVEEGQILNSAIMSNLNTEISLQGIASADVVMTGGGTAPFMFELCNILMA